MSVSVKKNGLLNIIKTLSSIIFPVITLPYISRTLMPENIGKVNFSVSYVGYFALIASLGITTYGIRECAAVKNEKDKLSKTASELFSINIVTSVISYCLLIISLFLFEKSRNYSTLIIIYSSTIIFTTIGADWLNSAMEDFVYISVRTICFQFLSLILMLLFVKDVDDYIKYIYILAFSTSGANLLNAFYRKRYCKLHFTFHRDMKRHLGPIFLLFVMTLSQTIFNNADITMLGVMRSDFEVGLYSTAYKVTNVISQVVQSIIFVLIPRLSTYFAQERYDEINILLRKLLQFNIGLGLPITVGIIMLSDDIMYLVGGDAYLQASSIISVLMLNFLFSLVGGSFLGNAILIPSKKEKYYMLVCSITAVINIILNYLLIPDFGALGAAIATAINGLLIFILLLVKRNKKIAIASLDSVFIAPVIGCGIIVIVCLIFQGLGSIWLRLILSISMSIMFYTVVLIMFKYDLLMDVILPILNKTIRKRR